MEHFKEDERDLLFNLLPPEEASEVIVELDDFHREHLLEDLHEDRLSELVDEGFLQIGDIPEIARNLLHDNALRIYKV